MDSSLAHLISWSETTNGAIPAPLTVSPASLCSQLTDIKGPSITISPVTNGPPTIFLFGGKYVHNRKLTNEMWAMDLAKKTWSKVDAGPGPGPRYFHSMDVCEFTCDRDPERTSTHQQGRTSLSVLEECPTPIPCLSTMISGSLIASGENGYPRPLQTSG